MHHNIVLLITPITIIILLLSILKDKKLLSGIPTLTSIGIATYLSGAAIQLFIGVAHVLDLPNGLASPFWVLKDIGVFIMCISTVLQRSVYSFIKNKFKEISKRNYNKSKK